MGSPFVDQRWAHLWKRFRLTQPGRMLAWLCFRKSCSRYAHILYFETASADLLTTFFYSLISGADTWRKYVSMSNLHLGFHNFPRVRLAINYAHVGPTIRPGSLLRCSHTLPDILRRLAYCAQPTERTTSFSKMGYNCTLPQAIQNEVFFAQNYLLEIEFQPCDEP